MTEYNRRKTKYIFALIISLVTISVLFFVYDSSKNDNKTNVNEGMMAAESVVISAPDFSKESGFYSNPFYLKISVPKGTKVYYTLDSSDPDENSLEYDEPIYLEDASKKPNVYSMRTDVSAGFYSDLIKKYNTLDQDPEYVAPDYLIDKCNIVRAVAIDGNGNKSDVITKSYFIGLSPKEYKGCNVITVTTDPNNLFDYDRGIYVTGKTFDSYLNSHDKIGSYWRFWEANYRQKGSSWERNASFSFFDANGNILYSKEGGIRIQGGVSRGALPRNLNIYSNAKYDGQNIFEFDLIGDGNFYQSYNLTAGGNQTITAFNDYMMSKRTKNLNYAIMNYRPYVVFLDGEYWGFYWLTNRFDETYISEVYNVDKENIVIIKNGEVNSENKDLSIFYDQLNGYLINNDMSTIENYKKACEIIDIDSFIDYYATQIYISRIEDWPFANYALWRTSEVRNDKYYDGKWRWMMFDSNSSSMKPDLIYHDTLNFVLENDEKFASLWQNDEFKKKFEKRIFEIADKCFSKSEMDEIIDDYTDEMHPILLKSWERFYGKDNDKSDEYYEKMNGYKEFFDKRKSVVESWFEN